MRHPGWSVASLAFSAGVLALGLFGRDFLFPPTEGERAARAVEEWIAAWLARDFDEVYRRSSPGPIADDIERTFRDLRQREDLAWDEGQKMLARTGRTREEARAMDPRVLFVALHRARPDEDLRKEDEFLRALTPDSVTVEGDCALVWCGLTSIICDRSDSGWKVRAWLLWGPRGGNSRKLWAFPGSAPDPQEGAVLEVRAGPEGWGEADLAALTERVRAEVPARAGAERAVLLDACPELPLQRVIDLMDAVLRAGVSDIRFAVPSARAYPAGLRCDRRPGRH